MMRLNIDVLSPVCTFGALCAGLCVHAQQAPQQPAAEPPRPAMQMPPPTPNDTLKSVEVQPDHHVRFRIWSPNATEVKLHAEGPEGTPGITPEETGKYMAGVPLTKGDQGGMGSDDRTDRAWSLSLHIHGGWREHDRPPESAYLAIADPPVQHVRGSRRGLHGVQSRRAARRNRNGLL
jgi:hypothetical protein